MRDALLQGSGALPNAANTVNANVIDLGATTPFPTTQKFQVRVVTTSGVGANSKNINIRLQESAESNANFTNIAELANPLTRITEGSSVYAATDGEKVTLPSSAKRYIRAVAVGEANGGDASNGTFTCEIGVPALP